MLWLNYFGGETIVYLFIGCIALTQIAKPFILPRFGSVGVRTFSSMIGVILGLLSVGYSSRSAMIGLSCGALSAFAWFVITARLEAGSWAAAGPIIAEYMKAKPSIVRRPVPQ